jgi:alkanesulfonate monooxygenase SsuD/methylene tetrahydromethanopterin reductase-like flavin-dependent oxidoreductase (luciferase family)
LRVGVTAWKFGTRGIAANLAEQGEIAEQIGFDSFWLPENHFNGTSSVPAPLMLLATIAARTATIGLGTSSYLLPIRNPIQAAEEVAVLDQLSGGRVILGIGRGYRDELFKVFSVPPKEKRKRFKKNLEAMIHAWQGEPIIDGNEPVVLAPLPLQKPYPRIWVAAFGPLAIKQAGTLGLPYIASPMESISTLEANYAAHRQHVADSGDIIIDTVPVMRTIFISNNTSVLNLVRNAIDVDDIDECAIIGDEAFAAEKIAEYEERLGLNYLIARGRIPGIESDVQIASHEALAKILQL